MMMWCYCCCRKITESVLSPFPSLYHPLSSLFIHSFIHKPSCLSYITSTLEFFLCCLTGVLGYSSVRHKQNFFCFLSCFLIFTPSLSNFTLSSSVILRPSAIHYHFPHSYHSHFCSCLLISCFGLSFFKCVLCLFGVCVCSCAECSGEHHEGEDAQERREVVVLLERPKQQHQICN